MRDAVVVERALASKIAGVLMLEDAYKDWAEELRDAIAAQPAEAEGAVAWAPSTALEKLKAGFNNAPCVLTDGPAEFNNVPLVTLAALSAVTAERYRLDGGNDALRDDLEEMTADRDGCAHQRDQLRAEVETWRTVARWSAVRMSGMLASAQYSMTPETTREVLELHHHVLAGTPEKIEWLAAMAAKEAR